MATQAQVKSLLTRVEKQLEEPIKLEKFDSDGYQLPAESLRLMNMLVDARSVLKSLLEDGITD